MRRNKGGHEIFSTKQMPWRVYVDDTVVAVFREERDARGFGLARYGTMAVVEQRYQGRPKVGTLRAGRELPL